MFTDDVDAEELEQRARTALPLLEQAGDHAGLAQVWFALAYGVYNTLGRYEEMTRAAEQSLREAALGGEVSFFRLAGLPMALRLGPCPADEALEKLDSILPPNPEPDLLMIRAALLAMLGRFDEAWSVGLPAAERWRELGGEAEHDDRLAEIAEFAGDHSKAAEYLRGMCDMLERRDSRGYLSTYAPMLGRSLCALGRYEEAEARAIQGRDLGAEDDFITQMLWRQVLARVHAHRADYAEAERLARAAVAIGEQTDALIWQADALRDLAEVLAAAGLTEEAADALEQALDRYERKKNLPMAAQVRQKLQSLSAGGHP
jgi:tetratricopeptide (TPR) repeat protein